MKYLLIMLIMVIFTTKSFSQTPQRVWSNWHGPRKIEYFKLGDTITTRKYTLIVCKPRQLNRQIAYVEQGYYKHCSMHKIKRIFKRNCKIKL